MTTEHEWQVINGLTAPQLAKKLAQSEHDGWEVFQVLPAIYPGQAFLGALFCLILRKPLEQRKVSDGN